MDATKIEEVAQLSIDVLDTKAKCSAALRLIEKLGSEAFTCFNEAVKPAEGLYIHSFAVEALLSAMGYAPYPGTTRYSSDRETVHRLASEMRKFIRHQQSQDESLRDGNLGEILVQLEKLVKVSSTTVEDGETVE